MTILNKINTALAMGTSLIISGCAPGNFEPPPDYPSAITFSRVKSDTLLNESQFDRVVKHNSEYYDIFELERQFNKKLKNAQYVSMSVNSNRIYLTINNSDAFKGDRINVSTNVKKDLRKITDYLRRAEKIKVKVHSFTSSQGAYAFNEELSTERALSIAEYIAHKGFNADKLRYEGYGETYPLYSNSGSKASLNNRTIIEIQSEFSPDSDPRDFGHQYNYDLAR